MFHVKRFVNKIKIFNLRTINQNNLVVSWKSRIFAAEILNNKNMAKYKITLEFETVVSVNGVHVNSETTRTTQIVEGVFADVAKVMFEHETNCIKHNRLPKLTKDVYTIFESKDSLNYINEYGCCVTQLCNRLGKDVSSFLQLIQTSERIK